MYEYENEHRPVENQQSYSYNFSPEPPVRQPEQHPQKKHGGAGKVVALLLACALAVSYTHLDVYKRQRLR